MSADSAIFARRFREYANEFDAEAAIAEADNVTRSRSRADVIRESERERNAGELIISASRRGFLTTIVGLAERVEWHTGSAKEDPIPSPKGPHAVYVRCATNLFIEVVGGHLFDVKNVGGRLEIVSDLRGGILPDVYPELFPTSPYFRASLQASAHEKADFSRVMTVEKLKRKAQTCRVLADIIDQHRLPPPRQRRLTIEDIDSFEEVRQIHPAAVAELLDQNGRIEFEEDFIQQCLEEILHVPFHKDDWGGEENDLIASNITIDGTRRSAAFLLKGKGERARTFEIRHCGQNGDQLVRLFQSPAEVFIVQFIGRISENLIKDVESKCVARAVHGKSAWYCIIDGQDTARLLRAYGKC